jgi:zinc transport system ATP-binding protein
MNINKINTSQNNINPNILISLNNIFLTRNGKNILQDVSLEISTAEFVTIIGPNGAGKSMLLKTILGIEVINSGEIYKKNGLKIGYVPQKIHLEAAMPITAYDFLKMVQGATPQNILEVLHEVGAETIANIQLHSASGGELQRILLARALLQNPNILILDEPAQNLDISGQLAFYQLLANIHTQKNIAVLMVSHDLHMVMASTNKVVCLFHHICCSGKPDVITRSPEFISLFGKDFSDMMAIYNHHHSHTHNTDEEIHVHTADCRH